MHKIIDNFDEILCPDSMIGPGPGTNSLYFGAVSEKIFFVEISVQDGTGCQKIAEFCYLRLPLFGMFC